MAAELAWVLATAPGPTALAPALDAATPLPVATELAPALAAPPLAALAVAVAMTAACSLREPARNTAKRRGGVGSWQTAVAAAQLEEAMAGPRWLTWEDGLRLGGDEANQKHQAGEQDGLPYPGGWGERGGNGMVGG